MAESERLGLFGGAFDPPHRGHVELLRRAREELALDRVIVVVVSAPGHKQVGTPVEARLALARAAFPGQEVVLDSHARTIEMLRAHPEWREATFLIGADQFCDFPSWQDPAEVLRLVQLGVATRPGFSPERLAAALRELAAPERVRFFELEPIPVASSELRERLASGDDVDADVPPAVLSVIRAEGLYGRR